MPHLLKGSSRTASSWLSWGRFLVVQVLLIAATSNNAIATSNSPSAAQIPRWSELTDPVFQNLTTERGLPSPIAQALAQDGDGYIWIGTQNGLARWDGYQFHTYLPIPGDPDSLPDSLILVLHTDKRGRLWVGTNGGGLARYDSAHDRFIVAKWGSTAAINRSVYSIEDDGKDGLWVGTLGGLLHLAADTNLNVDLHHDGRIAEYRPTDTVRAIIRDHDDTLWVGTQKGLLHFNKIGNKFVDVSLSREMGANQYIRCLTESTDGRIWVGTAGQGNFVIDPTRNYVQQIRVADSGKISQNDDQANSILETSAGQIWIGTNHGIIVIDPATLHAKRIIHDVGMSSSLINNTALAMLRDRSGMIWIGTEGGVSSHDPDQTGVASMFPSSAQPNHLADNNVTTVKTMPNGSIWLGLESNGVEIVDEAALKMHRLNADVAPPTLAVSAFTSPVDATIYVATVRGIFRTDALGKHFQHLSFPPLDVMPVNALLRSKNTLWAGAENGLWSISLVESKWQHAERVVGTEILNNTIIETLQFGNDDVVWIGTRNSGLYRLRLDTHELLQMQPDLANASALSSASISTLLFDSSGRLWIGTQGGGINLLEAPNDLGPMRFRHINTIQGLPNSNVDTLLMDTLGNIWASTDGGLAMIDAKTLLVHSFQREDSWGILPNYWAHSGAKTAQGELLFGGLGGLTVVRPELFKAWEYEPPLVVTGIRVGSKSVSAFQVMQANQDVGSISIKPDANSIAVDFSALDYSAPSHNRYTYRLEGFDTNWIESDATRRSASYTNLPPGNYRLRIRGSNRSGKWAKQEIIFQIQVLPAWYQTWWFYVAMTLVGIIVVNLIVKFRTRYLFVREQQLHTQVQQRTLELQQKQIEIVDTNHQLSRTNRALICAIESANQANGELYQSLESLQNLGEVGRQITANLTASAVFETLRRNMETLLNVQSLTIFKLDIKAATLERVYDNDSSISSCNSSIPLNCPDSICAQAARERTEIFVKGEANPKGKEFIPNLDSLPILLCIPLLADERILGVISIESRRLDSYDERERFIIRTLCSYGAIALDNANAYDQLHEVHQQMFLQEKMANLGMLMAGIAHEISNPLNYTHISAQSMEFDLVRFRDLLLKLSGDDAPIEITDLLNGNFDELYIKLDTIVTGTQRIRQLVQDLSTFSRQDQVERHRVAVVGGLRSTLNLVRAEFVHSVTFHLALNANPEVECWPALLNQVFMNVIVNACQAIRTRQQTNSSIVGELRISSRIDSGHLVIEFVDNGCGMSDSQMKRMFEPFYTTKEIGSGTGLGLYISNDIMEKHNGRFNVNSVLGEGTTFQLRLPLAANVTSLQTVLDAEA